MVGKEYLLSSKQMAHFVAKGYLRFDELIPNDLNQAIMRDIDGGMVKSQPAGTPLSQCYLPPSAVGQMLRLPEVQGMIQSLVGPDPLFDHQAVHVRQPHEDSAQHLHGDSTIDIRMHFDIQLMYFPHDVTPDMGGTLILPGSHFRRINEMDIARYQNFIGQIQTVCKAGTLLIVHHGIWHCGRQNKSDRVRYMFKVRLNPAVRQLRLWNIDDLTDDDVRNQTIFGGSEKKENIQSILGTQEPWFEHADGRIEIINRARLWRFLTGDNSFDVHYWLTRLENMPERVLEGAE
jgi:hypothetical protein